MYLICGTFFERVHATGFHLVLVNWKIRSFTFIIIGEIEIVSFLEKETGMP